MNILGLVNFQGQQFFFWIWHYFSNTLTPSKSSVIKSVNYYYYKYFKDLNEIHQALPSVSPPA
jgi:hypothetical protein